LWARRAPKEAVIEAIGAARPSENIDHWPMTNVPQATLTFETPLMPDPTSIFNKATFSLQLKHISTTSFARPHRATIDIEAAAAVVLFGVVRGRIEGCIREEFHFASGACKGRQCIWVLKYRAVDLCITAGVG